MVRVDMEFLFECLTWYLTSEHIFYMNIFMTTIFRRFPITFQRFSKIYQKLSEARQIACENSRPSLLARMAFCVKDVCDSPPKSIPY